MKIFSTLHNTNSNNSLYTEQFKTGNPNSGHNILSKKNPYKNTTHREKILSNPEMTSLHGLFGSDVPKEQNLYGHKIQHIFKGQFIDLKG